MAPLSIASAAFLATLLGGLVALRLKDRLHLILGFSAGAVVGVAFFDLLPEAIRLAPANPAGGKSVISSQADVVKSLCIPGWYGAAEPNCAGVTPNSGES